MKLRESHPRRRRLLTDERGAVLAIVALSIFALLGCVMITVDIGGIVVKRRAMVRAADSAALAAAIECAEERGSTAAMTEADGIAEANVDGAQQAAFQFGPEGCGTNGSGSVTVTYEDDQQLWFAPIFGFDENRDIGATAEAMWGPTAGGTVVPIALNAFPCDVQDEYCNFYFDNQNPPSGITNGSNWSWLSLNEDNGNWPADLAGNGANRNCSNDGANTVRDWISGGGVEVDLVGNPAAPPTGVGPTTVCTLDGAINTGSANSQTFTTMEEYLEGEIMLFPVVEGTADTTPGKAKYNVVGFASMLIEDVISGRDAYGTPGVAPSTGTCSESFSVTRLNPTFDLDTLYNTCLGLHQAPRTLSDIGDVVIKDGSQIVSRGAGVEKYVYDPITNNIVYEFKLTGSDNKNLKAEWTWNDPGTASTPGPCGEMPAGVTPDPNNFCLVMKFQKLIGGRNICFDCPDLGTRTVQLTK